MKTVSPLLSLLLVFAGCQDNTSVQRNPSSERIDPDGSFSQVLNEVDKAIGERMQSMEMGAMISATYMHDGSIDTVVAVVDPLVKKMGYKESARNVMDAGPAEAEMQEKMGMSMKNIISKSYEHKNGNVISVTRTNITHDEREMKMLTVHLMNPHLMSEMGSKWGTEK